MSNFISIALLKNYNPSSPNRGEDGYQKTVVVGGTTRVRISSQSLKRAVREAWETRQIRSGHFEDLIEKILLKKAETGEIPNDQAVIDKLGKEICTLIGALWDKRTSLEASLTPEEKKAKKNAEKEKAKESGSKEEKEKKRTMISRSLKEIRTAVDGVIEDYLKSGNQHFSKKNEAAVKKTTKEQCNNLPPTPEKVLFGTMEADKDSIFESFDGCASVMHSYSVDEYAGDTDDWTAVDDIPQCTGEDPFYAAFGEFAEEQKNVKGAVVMKHASIMSNLMYSATNVNISEFVEKSSPEAAAEILPEYVEAFALAVPSGKQNACSSKVFPTLLYAEISVNGKPREMCFDRVIKPTADMSVAEQAIRRVDEAYGDVTFIPEGSKIERYVVLPREHKNLASIFTNDGIRVVDNIVELKHLLSEKITEIS